MTSRNMYLYLYENLRHLGAIEWHNNRNSYYIKFKDCRIGSIRISNHNGRKQYNYTWKLYTYNTKEDLDNVIEQVYRKVLSLKNFNPNKYLVYKNGKYVELDNYNDYKKSILGVD